MTASVAPLRAQFGDAIVRHLVSCGDTIVYVTPAEPRWALEPAEAGTVPSSTVFAGYQIFRNYLGGCGARCVDSGPREIHS